MGDWAFVGRADELKWLRSAIDESPQRGAVLAGAAGVGKTRVAVECLHQAETAGFAIARVAGTRASAPVPFGAFAPLVPAFPAGGLEHGVDGRTERLHQVAAMLVEQAEPRRLALLADDAHLLDDASATLIHQLAIAGQVSILVTVRTGEPAPDPIVALWKDGLLERQELDPLSAQDLDDLLRSALPGVIEPGTGAHLANRSHGNVLFLRELVLGALHEGTLREDRGVWRLTGPLRPSSRLVEFVEARFAELTDDERALLEVVSFGEPIGIAELSALADLSAAEGLERNGLLTSSIEGLRLGIRLTHPLYGEILQTRTSALRRRAIARGLAEAVRRSGSRRREDVLRVASWHLDAGGGDASLMLEGARSARRRFDFPRAERIARAAIDAGAGFDAVLLLAHVIILQGRAAESERLLRNLARQAADDLQGGLVALERIDNYALNWGRIRDGLRLVEEAEAHTPDATLRDEFSVRRALLVLGVEGPGRAADMIDPLLDRVAGRARTRARLVGAQSFYRQGRLRDAVGVAGRAGARSSLTPQGSPSLQLVFTSQAMIELGELQEAEAITSKHYGLSIAVRSPESQAMFAWQLARLSLIRGEVVTAVAYGGEAVALLRELGRHLLVSLCNPTLVLALALSGRTDEALEASANADDPDLSTNCYAGVDPLEARAWIAAMDGDLSLARRLLEDAVSLGETLGDHVGMASSLHSLARLGYAGFAAKQMECVAAKIDGDLMAARLRHVCALATQDPQGLTEASSAFELLGANLFAAEAAADATVAWRRAGVRLRATSSARRAGDLASRCQGCVTPALQAIEARVFLTPAEREAVVRAASGRSNKEIAEELLISVRTAETYLQRAYSKLGVSNRKELRAVVLEPSAIGQRELPDNGHHTSRLAQSRSSVV